MIKMCSVGCKKVSSTLLFVNLFLIPNVIPFCISRCMQLSKHLRQVVYYYIYSLNFRVLFLLPLLLSNSCQKKRATDHIFCNLMCWADFSLSFLTGL